MPEHANNLGTAFGGWLMMQIDMAAGAAARRHCRNSVVTASIDRVDFHHPIQVGHYLTCTARVNGAGRSSMEIEVLVETENLLTGDRVTTNSCLLTFVAVDKNLRPVPVPALLAETEDDRRRAADAARRRSARKG